MGLDGRKCGCGKLARSCTIFEDREVSLCYDCSLQSVRKMQIDIQKEYKTKVIDKLREPKQSEKAAV